MVAKLMAVRKTTELQTMSMADLEIQTQRANDSTKKLRAIVAQLRKDVQAEEAMQLKVLNMIRAAYLKSRRAHILAVTAWRKQRIETKAAKKRLEKAHGEWEGTEMA